MKRFRLGLTAALGAAGFAVLPAMATAQSAPPAAPVCVALTVPSVKGVDDATSFGMAVRELFVSFLTGPSVETMLIEARLPSQAALEAGTKGCGQMLLVSVARTRSGGSGVGGVLGRAAGSAVMRSSPLAGGAAGAAASSATWAGGEAVYRFASQTRARDEIELSYRFGAPDAVARARAVSAKAKAQSDGEDLLTPLVEKAADGIVTAAIASGRK